MILRIKQDADSTRGTRLSLWCPGCALLHHVNVGGTTQPQWTWDGNAERPTIAPSILVRWHGYPGNVERDVMRHIADGDTDYKPATAPADQVCHSFVRAGRWEFLGDSTHELAGQTVDLTPIPDGIFT